MVLVVMVTRAQRERERERVQVRGREVASSNMDDGPIHQSLVEIHDG